jgi:hypothetical protein
MSDSTAEKGILDVISPTDGHYQVQQVWVLDATTNLPIDTRQNITFN